MRASARATLPMPALGLVVLVTFSGCFAPCEDLYSPEWRDPELAGALLAGGYDAITPARRREALPVDINGLPGVPDNTTTWRMNHLLHMPSYGASLKLEDGRVRFSATFHDRTDAATAREAIRDMVREVTAAEGAVLERFLREAVPDDWSATGLEEEQTGENADADAWLPGPLTLDRPLERNATVTTDPWDSVDVETASWDYEGEAPSWAVAGVARFNWKGSFEGVAIRGPESNGNRLEGAAATDVLNETATRFLAAGLPAPTFNNATVDWSHNTCHW